MGVQFSIILALLLSCSAYAENAAISWVTYENPNDTLKAAKTAKELFTKTDLHQFWVAPDHFFQVDQQNAFLPALQKALDLLVSAKNPTLLLHIGSHFYDPYGQQCKSGEFTGSFLALFKEIEKYKTKFRTPVIIKIFYDVCHSLSFDYDFEKNIEDPTGPYTNDSGRKFQNKVDLFFGTTTGKINGFDSKIQHIFDKFDKIKKEKHSFDELSDYPYYSSGSPSVQFWSSYQTLTPSLIPALGSQNNEAQAFAIERLFSVYYTSDETIKTYAQPIVEKLVPLIPSLMDLTLKADGLHTLGRCGPAAKGALPLLTQCTKDEEGRMRHEAFLALDNLGVTAQEVAPELIKELKNPNDKINAAQALSETGIDPQIVDAFLPDLIQALNDTAINHWIVKTLGKIGSKAFQAIPALIESLKNARQYDEMVNILDALQLIESKEQAVLDATVALLINLKNEQATIDVIKTLMILEVDGIKVSKNSKITEIFLPYLFRKLKNQSLSIDCLRILKNIGAENQILAYVDTLKEPIKKEETAETLKQLFLLDQDNSDKIKDCRDYNLNSFPSEPPNEKPIYWLKNTVLHKLISFLNDPNVSMEVVILLRNLKPNEYDNLYLELEKNPDPEIQSGIIEVISSSITSPDLKAKSLAVFLKQNSPDVDLVEILKSQLEDSVSFSKSPDESLNLFIQSTQNTAIQNWTISILRKHNKEISLSSLVSILKQNLKTENLEDYKLIHTALTELKKWGITANEITPEIQKFLINDHDNYENDSLEIIRQDAALAWFFISNTSLVNLLKNANPEVKRQMGDVILGLDPNERISTQFMDHIIEGFSISDPAIQIPSAIGILEFPGAPESLRLSAGKFLISLLSKPDRLQSSIREKAYEAVGSFGWQAIPLLLSETVKSGSEFDDTRIENLITGLDLTTFESEKELLYPLLLKNIFESTPEQWEKTQLITAAFFTHVGEPSISVLEKALSETEDSEIKNRFSWILTNLKETR